MQTQGPCGSCRAAPHALPHAAPHTAPHATLHATLHLPQVRPCSGTALLFCNVAADGEPDPRVCHRACPVPPGHHKFGCNVWIADCTMGPTRE